MYPKSYLAQEVNEKVNDALDTVSRVIEDDDKERVTSENVEILTTTENSAEWRDDNLGKGIK